MSFISRFFDPQLQRALRLARDPGAPLLISLVPERFEDGAWSGVPRFDWELRKVFPELISLADTALARLTLSWLAKRKPDAIVITGNETSLVVPEQLRTIVVHHGCAQTHFDRDPEWRGRVPQKLCAAQRAMYARKNRRFVAPSAWVAEQFATHYGVAQARVVPHWVPPLPAAHGGAEATRKIVLGDFRTWNKGRDSLPKIAAKLPQIEFRPLRCTYQTRQAAYAQADAYLSLSLSEGGSYALCDAEAARLPIVMTDVGNCREFRAAHVLPWQARDHSARIASALEQALSEPRAESFYASYDLTAWQNAWRDLVAETARSPIE